MRLFPKFISCLSVLTFSVCLFAQNAPMKFGKVSDEDIRMTVYSPDSTASAVILCNYGFFNASKFEFTHQMRIKILTEEGKERGNFYVPAAQKTNVRGQVINMENGIPVVTKLTKSGIFIERITRDIYRARVAMPNVKAGSVIDVEFFYQGLPGTWNFQETIPVKWSELIIEPNSNVSFKRNFVGYTKLSTVEEDRWVAGDVPAFISEPFVNNERNYISHFDIELSSIHIPGYFYKDYATNWKTVADALRNDDDFGGIISNPGYQFSQIAKSITEQTTDTLQRIKLAYEAAKKIKWNKDKGIFPGPAGIYESNKNKTGNVAEINLSLLMMLKKLNIEAYPVVLSTRDNGVLSLFSASIDKLNYLIVAAKTGNTRILLDATDEFLTPDVLPSRVMNGQGLLIPEKSGFEWVELKTGMKNKENFVVNLTLENSGNLKGEINKISQEAGAYELRKTIKSFNSQDEYISDLENQIKGLKIDDYKIDGLDSLNLPVNEKMQITLKNFTDGFSDQIRIHPMIFNRISENPFKAVQRVYPIDFTVASDRKMLVNIQIPEGYQIEQLPKSARISMPENGMQFIIQTAKTSNNIQIMYRHSINKPVFYQTEYELLKGFYDEMIKKESEMIILKKI